MEKLLKVSQVWNAFDLRIPETLQEKRLKSAAENQSVAKKVKNSRKLSFL